MNTMTHQIRSWELQSQRRVGHNDHPVDGTDVNTRSPTDTTYVYDCVTFDEEELSSFLFWFLLSFFRVIDYRTVTLSPICNYNIGENSNQLLP